MLPSASDKRFSFAVGLNEGNEGMAQVSRPQHTDSGNSYTAKASWYMHGGRSREEQLIIFTAVQGSLQRIRWKQLPDEWMDWNRS